MDWELTAPIHPRHGGLPKRDAPLLISGGLPMQLTPLHSRRTPITNSDVDALALKTRLTMLTTEGWRHSSRACCVKMMAQTLRRSSRQAAYVKPMPIMPIMCLTFLTNRVPETAGQSAWEMPPNRAGSTAEDRRRQP